VDITVFPQNPVTGHKLAIWQALFLLVFCFFSGLSICAQENAHDIAKQTVSIKLEDDQMVIEGKNNNPVISFSKNVLIKSEAQQVLCFGCDVTIEGRVEGDVAVVGGILVQRSGAFIGGDVIVFGGKYQHDDETALRGKEGETVVFAGYEEELRHMAQNPTDIFAPQLTVSFVSLRLLAVLFWFIISLALTTIAPGAVSRAATRLQLSSLIVVGVGFLGFLGGTILVAFCAGFLPNYAGVLAGVMTLILLLLAYVFGRVTLQAIIGKWLLKRMFSTNGRQSEALALLLGSFVCTLLISLPYIWTFTIFVMLIISVGLVLTGIPGGGWKKSEKM
jgi:hypothetical protein